MTRARLESLGKLAQMVLDQELSHYRRLAQARAATRTCLDKLPAPEALLEDPACLAARQVHLKWAAAQRITLNQVLAAQTAQLMEQRRKTARSLGRVEALSRILADTQNRRLTGR